eukprot:1160656-Pelagomonas_calceolata.AAC.11
MRRKQRQARPLAAPVLMLQVEYADVLVINKVDTVSGAQARQLELILRKLNRSAEVSTSFFLLKHVSLGAIIQDANIWRCVKRSAEIVQAVHGQVPARLLLETKRFSLAELEQAPGWLAELNAFFETGLCAGIHPTLLYLSLQVWRLLAELNASLSKAFPSAALDGPSLVSE